MVARQKSGLFTVRASASSLDASTPARVLPKASAPGNFESILENISAYFATRALAMSLRAAKALYFGAGLTGAGAATAAGGGSSFFFFLQEAKPAGRITATAKAMDRFFIRKR